MNICRTLKAHSFAAGLIASVLVLTPCTGVAQSYPNKPIRLIVPLPPGTANDLFTRLIAQRLSDIYKQQVVVDNRPGAGGVIASSLLVRAPADGYTLAMIGNPHLAAALIQATPPYRPLDDIAAITQVGSIPNVLVVAPNVPATTVQELIAHAKANPGKLNFASAGVGTSAHLAAEILSHSAGISVVHVPFKVMGDVYSAMLAGQMHFFVFTLPSAMPMLREGKLRALAITTAKRTSVLPNVPTIVEAGLPDAQSEAWIGLAAPAGVPRETIARLHLDVVKILGEPEILAHFAKQGAVSALDSTSESFTSFLKAEYVRYQKIIKDIGISSQ